MAPFEKRSLSKLTYLSFDHQRLVSKQGRIVTMSYSTILLALLQLCGGDFVHLPQVSSARYVGCLSKHLKGRYLP